MRVPSLRGGLLKELAEYTEQTRSSIGSVRNVAFHCQVRDQSVFYGTSGNPTRGLVLVTAALSSSEIAALKMQMFDGTRY